jgi:hypothetical protein
MKVLVLDIETAPNLAYTWGAFKQNIGANQFIEPSYLLSCASKWLGKDEVFYEDVSNQSEEALLEHICGMLDEADFVIAHNGARFDIPKIRGRALVNGLTPPSPVKVIDTLHIARREFGFTMNSLKYLAEILDVTMKDDHKKFPGFELWVECIKNNPEAWEEMRVYNIGDIVTLEEIYMKIRGWSSTHPSVITDLDSEEIMCPTCGSTHIQKRGFSYTNVGKFQRYQCQEKDCHSWFKSRYTLNTISKRKSIMASI